MAAGFFAVVDSSQSRDGLFRRSWLYLRQLRAQNERSGWHAGDALWKVHNRLEKAEGWNLESEARYGKFKPSVEMTGRSNELVLECYFFSFLAISLISFGLSSARTLSTM